MAEPNTSGVGLGALGTAAVAIAGPVLAPYAIIIAGALIGAQWPLQSMELDTAGQKKAAAWFLVRVVSLAVLMSSAGAWYLHDKTGLPIYDASAVISGGIGAVGNGWGKIFTWLSDGVIGLLQRIFGGKSDGNS